MKFLINQLARIVPQCNGPCGFCEFAQMLQNIVNFLTLDLAIPLSTIAIVVGGFLWIFSGGNEERIKKGKDAIKGGVIGLVVTLSAWVLINFFLNMITGGKLTEILGHPWHKIECP